MRNTVLVGDCLAVLKTLPSDSVHCCVTSPPYWGLRNYGVEPSIWGGDPMCGHDFGILVPAQKQSGGTQNSTLGIKSSGPTMSPAKQVETIEHQSHDGQSVDGRRRAADSGGRDYQESVTRGVAA